MSGIDDAGDIVELIPRNAAFRQDAVADIPTGSDAGAFHAIRAASGRLPAR